MISSNSSNNEEVVEDEVVVEEEDIEIPKRECAPLMMAIKKDEEKYVFNDFFIKRCNISDDYNHYYNDDHNNTNYLYSQVIFISITQRQKIERDREDLEHFLRLIRFV